MSKIIKSVVSEKTTAELFHYIDYSIYTGITEFSYLHFYGTRSLELSNKLNEFIKERESLVKEKWNINKESTIKELENQLLNTKDGWFFRPSKNIKNKIFEEKNKKWIGISEGYKYFLYLEFLSQLNSVKISSSDHRNIYEILPDKSE